MLSNFRNQLLKDGAFLLSNQISPRIFNIITETKEKLDLEGEYEVFCINSTTINAFAYVQPAEDKNFFIVGITSAALEELEDEEDNADLSALSMKLENDIEVEVKEESNREEEENIKCRTTKSFLLYKLFFSQSHVNFF